MIVEQSAFPEETIGPLLDAGGVQKREVCNSLVGLKVVVNYIRNSLGMRKTENRRGSD